MSLFHTSTTGSNLLSAIGDRLGLQVRALLCPVQPQAGHLRGVLRLAQHHRDGQHALVTPLIIVCEAHLYTLKLYVSQSVSTQVLTLTD